MSILKMKHLTAVVPKDEKRKLMRALYRLGCVEIETKLSQDTDYEQITEDSGSEDRKKTIAAAISELSRLVPYKKSMLSPKRGVCEDELFSEEKMSEAAFVAENIKTLISDSARAKEGIVKAETSIQALAPWSELPYPLDFEGSKTVSFICAMIPVFVAKEKIEQTADPFTAEVKIISSDKNQHYISILVHKSEENALLDALKPLGFARVNFKEKETALEEIASCRSQISELRARIKANDEKTAAFADKRQLLENAFDACAQDAGSDKVLASVEHTRKTVVLTGWVPEEACTKLEPVLEKEGCAWSLEDPTEGDDVPTAMKNSKFVAPFDSITKMYGMPAYNSIVDPNPLITPFYILFFGFIIADAAYGLLMFIGCLLALKLMKPKGGTKSLLQIFMYCGLSAVVAGALTGGWFADAITIFSTNFFHKAIIIPPIWFDPLKDPMTLLIFSLVLGVIQILFAMGVSGYRQIKRGDWLGAIFDVGSWYMIFAGGGLFAAGFKPGLYVCIAGAVLLLCTAGRDKKGLGKITGGLGALYGITGYLSDILSYSRIMALALSGAVVGQVVNKMGVIAGDGIIGFLVFLAVFLFGHTFNIAISLLGAYVHTNRLQYIEFFGRFYEGGGRHFKPLIRNTKFVDIRED